jgi:hypothetical protein
MKQLRISARDIGELALDNFCARCFWIKLKCKKKLPYQSFPGIFSSIDSYTKKVTNSHFGRYRRLPNWFSYFGISGEPVRVPNHSTFNVLDDETNILLTGVPDEILLKKDGSYLIIDYKTAKLTGTQDELLPMYEVQLNAYAFIAEKVGFNPVSGLGLIYYEPQTELSNDTVDSFMLDDGFSMHFSGKPVSVELNPDKIKSLLRRVRDIFDMSEEPRVNEDCGDCRLLEILLSVVS